MKHPDMLWFDIVNRFAQQSRCTSRKVGCVIVYEDRLIGQGWNSPPEGSTIRDCPRERCQNQTKPSGSDLTQAICCHAEASSLGYCARHGISTRGAKIYLSCHPCTECAKLIVAAGIVEVIYSQPYNNPLAILILKNANIKTREFEL